VDKKNLDSKAKYGTLTATQDANNDYSKQSEDTGASSSMLNSTLTAKYDANNDYGGQNQGKNAGSQSGSKKNAGTTTGK